MTKYLHLGNLSALVVSSQDGYSVSEAHLKGNKKSHGLNRVVSAINIISHEQIVGVGRLATDSEQFAQVAELSVDVAADCYRCAYFLHVRLIY